MQSEKLFFVNFRPYLPGLFNDIHANTLVVAETKKQVKLRPRMNCCEKQNLFTPTISTTLMIVLKLKKSTAITFISNRPQISPFEPNNDYHVIPKAWSLRMR